MAWNPTSHAGNIAVLVIDKNHPCFGQLGKQEYHDWRESGLRGAVFEGGERHEFQDGLLRGEVAECLTFYAWDNEKGADMDREGVGPKSLVQAYIMHGFGDEEVFRLEFEEVFGEPFEYHAD